MVSGAWEEVMSSSSVRKPQEKIPEIQASQIQTKA